MTYKPRPRRNYSQAFKSDSIKSQLQQRCWREGGREGESPPPHNPTLSLAHSNTPLFNELITKDARAEQYGFVTNTLYIAGRVRADF